MRVFVDQDDSVKPTEFAYLDEYGNSEYVKLGVHNADIYDAAGNMVRIYKSDVLKLIKALEAAYDQITKEKS